MDAAWDIDAIVRTVEADGYRITEDLVTHFPDQAAGSMEVLASFLAPPRRSVWVLTRIPPGDVLLRRVIASATAHGG